jgi:uncharacterized repeat protein (TIGR04076 family)
MDLIIKVKEIRGCCPVYEVGHSISLRDGYILDTKSNEPLCMHSLASLLPYYVALAKGVKAKEVGLSGPDKTKAYLQCLDPCDITGGGTVIFEIYPIREKKALKVSDQNP